MSGGLPVPALAALIRAELRRALTTRRGATLFLAAAAPVLLAGLRALSTGGGAAAALTSQTSQVLHLVLLRSALVLGTADMLAKLFSADRQEGTLAHLLLAPLPRAALVLGRFAGAAAAVAAAFSASLVLTAALLAVPAARAGMPVAATVAGTVAGYLPAVAAGTVAYGAVFLLLGLLLRTPAIPILLIYGWELLVPFLPTGLKAWSLAYHVGALAPPLLVHSTLEVVAAPENPVLAVAVLVAVSILALAAAARLARRLEATPSA